MSENKKLIWNDLQSEIVNCRKCSRLVNFREQIGVEKRKQFREFDYWARPVPSNGTLSAKLLVIGLAPAAHGGNRTGRMFTGDQSARFLFKHLFEAGFANQPNSDLREDGQKLIDSYITAVAHCVPPENKLTLDEIRNCSSYLEREFDLLKGPKVVLSLGRVAFDAIMDYARKRYGITKRFEFSHGKRYFVIDGFPLVYASYHPSPRNTQTGKLTSEMFSVLLEEIREVIYAKETVVTRPEKRAKLNFDK
jgi:uracil-DNA glycosylase